MGNWFHHWVFQDLYVPVWPNIVAEMFAFGWLLRRIKKHFARHHEAQERRHSEIMKAIGGGDADSG